MEVYDIQTESGEYLSGNLRVHNCFILAVDDSMDSILNWYKEEGLIFKGGSGAGLNLSRIRSSQGAALPGGTASGPVSFMRGADASRGHDQVRWRHPARGEDGGARRRPPGHRGVHRDQGARGGQDPRAARRRVRHGPRWRGTSSACSTRTPTTRSGSATSSCVRSRTASEFGLRARLDGRGHRDRRRQGAVRRDGAGGVGVRRPRHPVRRHDQRLAHPPETGRITASNPCSEYMHLDNSICNLA